MWTAYIRHLKTFPVRTNIATATFVTATGDALAQQLEVRWSPGQTNPAAHTLDLQRLTTVTAYWAASSPALFAWFRWLDGTFPTSAALPMGARLINLSKKLTVHQWSFVPLVNGVFFMYLACIGEASGRTAPSSGQPEHAISIIEAVSSQLWETQKTSVVVWGIAHTFNFLFLPTHTRVLFNSSVGVLWSAYMSTVGHRQHQPSNTRTKSTEGIST
jgi:hypothetical protein